MKDPQTIRDLYGQGLEPDDIAYRLRMSPRRVRAIIEQEGGKAPLDLERQQKAERRSKELSDAPEVEQALEALIEALELRYGPRFVGVLEQLIIRRQRGMPYLGYRGRM